MVAKINMFSLFQMQLLRKLVTSLNSLYYCYVYRLEGSKESRVGFASQLHLLVDALQMSFEAHFIEDFVSGSNLFWCII
jgi:hypothetical protein